MEEIKKIEVQGQQYGVADILMRSVMGGNAQVIEWSHTHNMNDYKDAGTYRIKGERTGNPLEDNLPIMNQGSGHTIEGILYVLDNGSGNTDDCTVTQFLMLSNRVGGQEGDMYMRSGYGATKDSLYWKPWEKYQTNMEVGVVCDTDTHSMQDFNQIIVPNRGLNDFIDNGIYSGVYLPANATTFYDYETFVMLTINNYALAENNKTITQIKFAVNNTGVFSMEKRSTEPGNTGIWSQWESIGGGLPASVSFNLSSRNKYYFGYSNAASPDLSLGSGVAVGDGVKIGRYVNIGDNVRVNNSEIITVEEGYSFVTRANQGNVESKVYVDGYGINTSYTEDYNNSRLTLGASLDCITGELIVRNVCNTVDEEGTFNNRTASIKVTDKSFRVAFREMTSDSELYIDTIIAHGISIEPSEDGSKLLLSYNGKTAELPLIEPSTT